MAIGQVPVQVACTVPDGIALHMEDVDGIGVPSMSMTFSMKVSLPIHDLLKMLISVQEHEARSSKHVPSPQAVEETRKEAKEACEAAKGPVALRHSRAFVAYKAQNGWERISAPKAVLLEDEMKLRGATFQALPLPEHRAKTYADFKDVTTSLAVTAATVDAETSKSSPRPFSPKAPPVPQAPPRRRSAPVLLAVPEDGPGWNI